MIVQMDTVGREKPVAIRSTWRSTPPLSTATPATAVAAARKPFIREGVALRKLVEQPRLVLALVALVLHERDGDLVAALEQLAKEVSKIRS